MAKRNSANNQTDIKRGNVEAVFNTIAESGGISRARLSKTLSLSRSTVTVIVDGLKSKGLVIDTGVCDEASSGVGRTAFAVNVNSADNYIAVAEASIDTINCAAFDLKTDQVAAESLTYKINETPMADAIVSCARQLAAGLAGKKIWALGCIYSGSSGFIDYRTQKFQLIDTSGLSSYGFSAAELSGKLGIPVCIYEGAIVLGMMEHRKYHRASKTFAYLYISDGVCVNIFQEGELLRGAYGPMSEFGHMSVNLAGPRCVCGNRGCLEMYVSNRALVQYYAELRGKAPYGARPEIAIASDLAAALPSWGEIVDRHAGGDPVAGEAVAKLNDAMAVGVINLINLINPDTVVLGGTASRYGEGFLERIRQKVSASAVEQYRESTAIAYARHDGGIIAPGVAHDAQRQNVASILFPE